MITKRAMAYFLKHRKQFFRYIFVGGSGVFLDISSLALLKEILLFGPVQAVLLNQCVVLVYNFTLNKYWSFESKTFSSRQIVRYGTLVAFNYCFSAAMMYLGAVYFSFHYVIVRLASIALMVSWNFFLYKYWVYQEK